MKATGIIFLLISCFAANSYTQETAVQEDSLVQKFSAIADQNPFWLSTRKNIRRATDWLAEIESSEKLGLAPDKLQIDIIRSALHRRKTLGSVDKEQTDKQITNLVLHFLKDLQQGNITLDYDEVTVPRDAAYSNQLLKRKKRESVSELVARLDCKDPDYLVLKNFLHDSITVKDTLKYKEVVLAMNYRRYLTANHQPEYLIVNIPEAEACYYRNDKLFIKMRTVVGNKKTPTPTIASYITSIVTFPYWNVPHSIAINELLPKAQKNESYLEQNNFEVVDAKGNIIEDSELDLKEYNAKDFPYYFRQSTGAENDLGVIKFNLQNPFSIFLHSTSSTSSFTRDLRFLSHGCIRLEKPFELADALLRGKIDIAELRRGKKNTESETLQLLLKIPVFIIYVLVKVESGKVTFLRDVYGLIK
jgi:murein L,D-transpeptidase YcbB/YkuD